MHIPLPVLASLEAAVNRYLAMDPATLTRLGALQGKVLALELRGFGTRIYVMPGPAGLRLLGDYDGEVDAHLEGTPLGYARMAAGAPPRALFTAEVRISGDTELGQRFKNILDDVDIDWEEQLSHITGDVLAHQAGRAARGSLQWARQAGHRLGESLAEYLEEEARLLPTPLECEEFAREVARLRADADRLEARVRRLHDALNPR